MNIIECMESPDVFQPWFQGESWAAWKTVLRAAFALPMSDTDLARFGDLAGGRMPPAKRVKELLVIAGRRSGKDSVASQIATFAAGIEEGHIGNLRPGERATVLCLACDRDQAAIIKRYIVSYFQAIPELKAKVTNETKTGLELDNGVEIIIGTNDYRAVRGRAILVCILDEAAFFSSENSASPDIEVDRALDPAMATLPCSLKIIISSPYRKSGLVYGKWRASFGKDDDRTLVIQAKTSDLNPLIDPEIIARALRDDRAAAMAEWLGIFRDDIAAFISREIIEAAVDVGVQSRSRRDGVRYQCFVDAASGGGGDSFTAAISHLEGDVAVVDVAHEIRPPFNPQSAIAEIALICQAYGIVEVTGDRWAPGFVADAFLTNRLRYNYSDLDRSAIYLEALPALVSGRVRLPDNDRLVSQLATLERKTSSSGRDRIDHPSSGNYHDDVANAVCGSIALALGKSEPGFIGYMRDLAEGPQEPVRGPLVRMRAPLGVSHVQLWSGPTIGIPADRTIEVSERDAGPLLGAGFTKIERNAA